MVHMIVTKSHDDLMKVVSVANQCPRSSRYASDFCPRTNRHFAMQCPQVCRQCATDVSRMCLGLSSDVHRVSLECRVEARTRSRDGYAPVTHGYAISYAVDDTPTFPSYTSGLKIMTLDPYAHP